MLLVISRSSDGSGITCNPSELMIRLRLEYLVYYYIFSPIQRRAIAAYLVSIALLFYQDIHAKIKVSIFMYTDVNGS